MGYAAEECDATVPIKVTMAGNPIKKAPQKAGPVFYSYSITSLLQIAHLPHYRF
jgi:hypothetical protein